MMGSDEQEVPSTPRAPLIVSTLAPPATSIARPPVLPFPRLVTFVTHEAPGLRKLRDSAALTAGPRGLEVVFTTTRFGALPQTGRNEV